MDTEPTPLDVLRSLHRSWLEMLASLAPDDPRRAGAEAELVEVERRLAQLGAVRVPCTLPITDESRARAHAVAVFCARPENWYRPTDPRFDPGDGEGHRVEFGPYLCVFSYTLVAGVLYRSVTITLPISPGFYPPRLHAQTIAAWFGFTGGRPDADGLVVGVDRAAGWVTDVLRAPIPGILLVQRIGAASLP